MPNLRPQELLIIFLILMILLVVTAFFVWLAVSLTPRSGRSEGLRVASPSAPSAGDGSFCRQCGSPLAPQARFCSDCGVGQS